MRTSGLAISTPASHFVEGWNAGFAGRTDPVCTMTEGYLAGAHHAVTGETVAYKETACMMGGAERCVFERQHGPREPIAKVVRTPVELTAKAASVFPKPKHIDGDKIVSALVDMPIHGNDEGLIPAFGVYLANTPADFYNLVCIRFVEEMSLKGLGRNAQRLLISDAETCAHGIDRCTGSAAMSTTSRCCTTAPRGCSSRMRPATASPPHSARC